MQRFLGGRSQDPGLILRQVIAVYRSYDETGSPNIGISVPTPEVVAQVLTDMLDLETQDAYTLSLSQRVRGMLTSRVAGSSEGKSSSLAVVKSPSLLSEADLTGDMIDTYLLDGVLPDANKSMLKLLHDDPSTRAHALAYYNRRLTHSTPQRETRLDEIGLTTSGDKRYFSYIPQGHQSPVLARVLDIHLGQFYFEDIHPIYGKSNYKYPVMNILIEEAPRVVNGQLVRVVRTLNMFDLMTLDISSTTRQKSFFAFYNSLTSHNITTIKLAYQLGLTQYGYSNINRRIDIDDALSFEDPLSYMSNAAVLAIQASIEESFPNVDLTQFMLPSEVEVSKGRLGGFVNVYDVFARLDARTVLKHFYNGRRQVTYQFVITEWGSLKIIPFKDTAGMRNFKPQNLRMAHGSRIYLAGTFTINGSDIYVDLNSEAYQVTETNGQSTFGTGFVSIYERVNLFLQETFRLHADLNVVQVNGGQVTQYTQSQNWQKNDWREDYQSGFFGRINPKEGVND